MRKTLIFSSLILVTLLAACGGPTSTPEAMMDKPTEAMMEKPTDAMMEKPTDAMMEKPTEDMMMSETATAEAMMHETPTPDAMMQDSTATPSGTGMMETPGWFTTSFTNVGDETQFTISDFKGKVVLVETMAVWCSKCKEQQAEIKALHEKLGMPADLVSISLDIDPNENAADLKDYVQANGFDWKYAVAPAEVSSEISKLYGAQFLNPPSTPILIVDRQGEVHVLPFGIKSADDLAKALEPYLKDGM